MIWYYHSIEYLLRKMLVIKYGLSLGNYLFNEIVSYDSSVFGYKYWLSLVRSTESLDRKIIWSEIIIWFVSKLGNIYGLSLGRYGGPSDGKIPGGEFGRWLVSKVGTDDGIWLGDRADWKLWNIEGPLMKVLVDVIFE